MTTGFDEQAEDYRRAQVRQLQKCYAASVGTPARTMEELVVWAEEHDGEIPHDQRGDIVPLYEDLRAVG